MVQALVKHRVVVDPTLIAYDTKFRGDDERYLGSPDLQLAPQALLDGWKTWTFTTGWTEADYRRGHRLWPKVLALVYRYWKAGVHLTTGSDFPNPWVVPGASLHSELELVVSAGIPPLEVLAMATSRGARALGVDGDRGTIETGKRADLVWLSADPSADIRKTRAIKGVMKQGRWVYRP